ncbi:MAG: hypothetical protein ACOYLH_12920 [Flavobacteriales bacterium]
MKFDLVFSAVKVLLGGGFLLFGLNGFFHFMPVPPPSNERARMFADLLASTKIMSVIQVFEILGGAMILSGRLAPLGLLLIGPIIIGILVFHLLLDVKNIAGILIFASLASYVAYRHRSIFAPFLTIRHDQCTFNPQAVITEPNIDK